MEATGSLRARRSLLVVFAPARSAMLAAVLACGRAGPDPRIVLTFPGSAVGDEARVLDSQLARFALARPDITVLRRVAPDAADQRHQLYVQWLAARAGDPDILQLDVIWTAEFAAAGWILPLDRFEPALDDFFPATVTASTWQGVLYTVPWFADVGLLYWRTDLLDRAPETFAELAREGRRAATGGGVPYGLVWQGARYEGLVTVFLEYLTGFGGQILSDDGRVLVDSEPAVRALTAMRQAIETGLVPRAALTWQEEPVRFAFQNGHAALMRNWPYATALLRDPAASAVVGRFAVASMPSAPGGAPGAALGGSALAINARTEHPEAAWALIEFLTRPAQMTERARVVGQFPTRRALYEAGALDSALAIPPGHARAVIERAVPRPVTPVYTELSELLQVRLHRALSGQEPVREALDEAAREMRALLARVGLAPPAAGARG